MIPKNPLTLLINGALTDAALTATVNSYLPNWKLQITSGYRTPAHNEEIGGKSDSAHIYNLGRDFVLINKQTGEIATDTQMKKLYEEFIKPNWEGYSEFKPKQANTNTGWIHANLDRGISEHVKWIAYAGTAAALALGVREIFKNVKTKLKGR